MDDLIILSRFIQFAALALLFGGALFRLCIAPPDQRPPWGRAGDVAAAVAALLSAIGWLVGVAVSMTGGWSGLLEPDTMAAFLFETRFGRLWLVRLALLAALLVLIWARRRRTRPWEAAMLMLAGASAASLAAAGHGTIGAGSLGLVHAVADVAHLLCAATWLGALACLALVLRRAANGDAGSIAAARTVLPRFSMMGYAAVAALLVTGCVNSAILVARPEALIGSEYGRVLLVKIVLVGAMIALAACNRLLLLPRVLVAASSREGMRALYRSVALEQAIGLLVLAAVAVLGTIHPPA